MNNEVKVTFQPSGRAVYTLPGTIILEAAARAGFVIQTPCGGTATCGKCLVHVTAGQCPASAHDRHHLDEKQIRDGFRLACRARISESLTIEIPETSLFQSVQKILAHDNGDDMDVTPECRREYVELPIPDRSDPRSDAERLAAALGDATIDPRVLCTLPTVLRDGEFRVTATLVGNRAVYVTPGRATAPCLGIAFDIGTTTLVGTMVDASSGKDLAVASMINPQTAFGDDVLSRICRCRDNPAGLAELRNCVVEAVNGIIRELCEKQDVAPDTVCELVFAGNTTMQQILCNIDPRALGELPFVPAFRDALTLEAGSLGLHVTPSVIAHVFPQIGGFVGGDTVAGILATRLDKRDGPALLVDVGTNGEIVLAHEGRLTATSVAAGPAFEGARIINGMRATSGAIEKVVVDGDIHVNVIGNARPVGICGTGLVDATAALLRLGILDATGRIVAPDELPASLPAALTERIIEHNNQPAVVLVSADESANGEPLCLYQKDLRELQLANGAIRAGISILLEMEGLTPDDLSCVLLAGAFGNFIRRRNAQRIGMLPAIPRERIQFVGNTASFGAKRFLLSAAERRYADRIVRKTDHIDLSCNPGFQMAFGDAMLFPEAEACDE